MTKLLYLAMCLPACVDEHEVATTQPAALTTRWTISLGGTGPDSADSVAIDHAGDVIAVGAFENRVDFGDRLATAADEAGWLSKRAAADGHAMWTRTFAGDATNMASLSAVAIAPDDSIVVTGQVGGEVDVGGQIVHGPPIHTSSQSFVAKYDRDGNLAWATPLDGDVGAVAIGGDGHVAVLGRFSGGTLHFPNADVTTTERAIFFAVLDSDGHLQWGKAGVGSTDTTVFTDGAGAIAMTETSDVVISGTLTDTMQLGVITTLHPSPTGQASAWVARYSVAGQPQWADVLGYSGPQSSPSAITLLDDRDVVLASNDRPTLDDNGRPRLDGIDAGGSAMWRDEAPSGSAFASALSAFADRSIVAAGTAGSSIDFGDGDRSGCSFVATYDEAGAFTGANLYGDATHCANGKLHQLSARGTAVAAVGFFDGPVDLGTGLVPNAGDADAVIAIFDQP